MSGGTFGWQGETLEFPAGVDSTRVAGVSPAGRARLRYNDVSKELEVSLDGGAYQVLSTGSDSPWVESPPGVVRLITPSNDVVIGGLLPVNGAQLTVIGETTTPQIRLQADGATSWIQLAPSVVAAPLLPPVDWRVDHFLTNGVENQVMFIGHNTAGQLAGRPQAYMQFEYQFQNAGVGAPIYSEFHWIWLGPTGTLRVPVSAFVNWTTELSQWGLTGSGIWLDSVGNPRMTIEETGRLVLQDNGLSAYFYKAGHNTPIIAGTAQNGTTVIELLRVSSNVVSNEVFMDVNQGASRWRLSSPGGLYLGLGVASAAALFEVDSTTRGLLFPRMTTVQRDAIAAPPDGLVIYNTSTGVLNLRSGGAWVAV